MKIVPSPLVSSMSGSTKTLTAATWKGRQYVRMKVKPANPQTAAQTLTRDAMTRLVQIWQALMLLADPPDLKTNWNQAAMREQMSGYNGFTKANLALERAEDELILMGDTQWPSAYGSPVLPVADFACAAGAPGEIDATWASIMGAGYHAMFFTRLTEASEREEFYVSRAYEAEESEAYTIESLVSGKQYDIACFVSHAVAGVNRYSLARADRCNAG